MQVRVFSFIQFQLILFFFLLQIVSGPGIPPANPATGGFAGGVRTDFKTLSRPKYPKAFEEEGAAYEERSRTKNKGYGY